jgi:hypothetical protein
MELNNRVSSFLQVLLALLTLLLLASAGGGGAIAAPILLPLQFFAARLARHRGTKVIWAILAAAVAAEGLWALSYVTFGDAAVITRVLPAIGAFAAAVAVFVVSRTRLAVSTG